MCRRTAAGLVGEERLLRISSVPAGRGLGAVGLIAAIVAMVILIGLHSVGSAWGQVAANAVTVPDAATQPSGSVGIRLVDIPAATADDPRTHEYIVDHVQPGETITRRIEVSNTTAANLDVTVYAGPATIQGDAFHGAQGRTQSELTSWVSLSEPTLTVPPGGSVMNSVTVTVPADAAPGEQYGVIWAEVNGSDNGAVALVARTGIRVYLSVGGNNPPASSLTITGLTAERETDGTAAVTGTVTNTGGRALDLSGTLNLVAVNGALTAGPYPVEVGTTLGPGDTGRVRALISDDITNGPWTATLELHSGLISDTATVELTFPTKVGSSEEVRVVTDPTPLIIVGGVFAATLIAFLAWLLIRRRRRLGTEAPLPKE